MKIDSKLFRLTLCTALLAASTMACSAPGATADASPTPFATVLPDGTRVTTTNPIQVPDSPVAMTVTEVKAGEGESLDGVGAFQAKVRIWSDKFEGTPFGRGNLELTVVPEGSQMPGLIKASKEMKVGGVSRLVLSAQELFGTLPANARIEPNTTFYIELTATEAFPKEEFKIETIKEGTGDKKAAPGDSVLMHYVGRLDNFENGTVFDSSRERNQTFPVELGAGQVIAGWEKGLEGMKKGELRRLSIPHYLAYGKQAKGKIPAKSRLFFEVELVDFITEGELKSETTKEGKGEAIKSGEKGEFHYTGWTDGFEGKEKFDSSRDRNKTIPVKLGAGQVIKGWDQGLVGMKPGEVRRLTIPYNLAYGKNGRPPTIKPFATLYFEVEYVGLAKGK